MIQTLPMISDVTTFNVTVTRRKSAKKLCSVVGETLETQVGLTVEANLILRFLMTWKTTNTAKPAARFAIKEVVINNTVVSLSI